MDKQQIGLIVLLVVVVVGFTAGGFLMDTGDDPNGDETNGNGEEILPGDVDAPEMEYGSLHMVLTMDDEFQDEQTGETGEIQMKRNIWLREGEEEGIDYREDRVVDEQVMVSQIYNTLDRKMYMMGVQETMGMWIYMEEPLAFIGELVVEYEEIALEKQEGDIYESVNPETMETIEWEIQTIETEDDFDDEKFEPDDEAISVEEFQELIEEEQQEDEDQINL